MEKYKICPNPKCGKHNKAKAIECLWCETDLSGVKPTDDETEAARAEAEEKKEQEKQHNSFAAPVQHAGQMTRICSECGAHNAPNARKCSACGEDISDIVPTEETEPQPVKACRFSLQSYNGDFVFEIPEEGCIVGRENAMSDYLSSKLFVSRQHASFKIEEDKLYIENISKTNFTYVNNVKIAEKTELKVGDEIGLGGNIVGGQRQDLAAYFIMKQD